MQCRFCWEGGNVSEFVSPCECSGSMKFVHIECIQKWIKESRSRTCNVCNSKYNMVIVDMEDVRLTDDDINEKTCLEVISCVCLRAAIVIVIVLICYI